MWMAVKTASCVIWQLEFLASSITRTVKSNCLLCFQSVSLLVVIIIVMWSKTVAPLHVLWQPLWTTTLIKGFQRRHELDPPRYVKVDLGDDSSSDQVFCLPSWQSPVVRHRLQGPRNPIITSVALCCNSATTNSSTSVLILDIHTSNGIIYQI